MSGLNEDGGISFSRELNEKDKKGPYGLAKPGEPKEEVGEFRNVDIKELAKDERLNAKLAQAKRINYSGFGINGATIVGSLFYLDSLLMSPDFMDSLNMINDMFGTDINFEQIITTIQGYKAQIIGFAISSQTMLMGYKDTVSKMKERGNESFYEVFTEELEKVGI